MAFTCGFFNSENGDRKYNAEQMSAIFDGIIADGVFTTIGDHMAVSAGTGMQVLVGTGKAWFDHTWNVNDAAYPLAIAASDVTLSRIDAIVLETNHSDSVRLNKLRVVQGTVASSPVKPTLTNSEKVHQHPLAWVTVAPGVTQIAASAIENAVGTSACPFVTGIIATTAIDDLFNQWNGEFDEWFDNLKAQLSDNVVANLQKQIDANKTSIATLSTTKVNISDKATEELATVGSDNTKWMTPYLVKKEIGSVTGEWKTFYQKNGNVTSEYKSNNLYNATLFTLPYVGQPGELDFTEILKARKVKETLKFTTNPRVIMGKYNTTIILGGIFLANHQIGYFGNDTAGSTITVNLTDFSWIYETPIYIDWLNYSGMVYHFQPSNGSWGLNQQKRLSFNVGPYISFDKGITQIQDVGFYYKIEYML